MLHPYQCIVARPTFGSGSKDILLAASRHRLVAFEIDSGQVTSLWPDDLSTKEEEEASQSSTEIITASAEDDLPAKKRRRIAKKKEINQTAPNAAITALVISRDGQHVVATTSEDKSVHVFSIDGAGRLLHLSQRRMPKRPCATALPSHDDVIFCGDKFGDVYALPMLLPEIKNATAVEADHKKEKSSTKPPKPSATRLTVHTVRNRKTLEAQMRAVSTSKPKEAPPFAHELLLGHVSMLTDIITVTLHDSTAGMVHPSEKGRSYILTADRDEHIRVSRGRPQSHVIESYCFGHKQFVSKLCLPHPRILVSGGGDNHLFVWDWLNGKILCKLDLQKAMAKFRDGQAAQSSVSEHSTTDLTNHTSQQYYEHQSALAVSGLWYRPESGINVLCACEGVPALFIFSARSVDPKEITSNDDFEVDIIPLLGNPLDVAMFTDYVVVSIDNIHHPGSKTSLQNEDVINPRVQSFRFLHRTEAQQQGRRCETNPLPQLSTINSHESTELPAEDAEHLHELLYGTENLRKRGNEDS